MKVYHTFKDEIGIREGAVCINGSFEATGCDPELLEDWVNKYGEIHICFDLEAKTATVVDANAITQAIFDDIK